LDEFRSFLRSLLMHAVMGTAVGGQLTEVGQPQNLLVGTKVEWSFAEFFIRCLPVSIFCLLMGLLTCVFLERFKWFGYGGQLPDAVRKVLENVTEREQAKQTNDAKIRLITQVIIALFLVVALGTHMASAGLVGLIILLLLTTFLGVVDGEQLGASFTEALPFAALLVVFFALAAVIDEQGLFRGIVHYVLDLSGKGRIVGLFFADAFLSSVSDSVFVAAVYINEVWTAYLTGKISRPELNILAVDVIVSTNVAAVATPNGQAAFLFLLTSQLAPLLQISYMRMAWMLLPYAIVLMFSSLIIVIYLQEFTLSMVAIGWLSQV